MPFECRRRPLHYRGCIWIHAGLAVGELASETAKAFADRQIILPAVETLPRGCLVARAILTDCTHRDRMTAGQRAFANYGEWGLFFGHVSLLAHPIPCRSQLGLFLPRKNQQICTEWLATVPAHSGACG
jgi:hypothetical protein